MAHQQYKLVDLRSDTLSFPTPAMRQAMFDAEVGDDVYGEDPTVNTLQERVAKLFNKEAAIFLPCGTMGNVIAMLAHCDRRGCEMIVGDKSHIFLYEQGAAAQLGGIHTIPLPNLPDGTFDLKLVEASIKGDSSVLTPITSLVAIENTQNGCGGKVLPLSWIKKVSELTRRHGIPLHLDGSRVFNAAAYLGISVAEIAKDVDTVQFCFSKGLGTPVGSMLIGSNEFIRKARRLRKVLGGGMRQAGVIAAPCLVALSTMVNRLHEDHQNLRDIALGIEGCKTPAISVDLDGLQTNILMVHFLPDVLPASKFCTRLSQVTEEEEKILGEDAIIVKVSPRDSSLLRIVTYWNITNLDAQKVVKKIQFIVKELLLNPA